MMPGQTPSEPNNFKAVLGNSWAKIFIAVSLTHLIAIVAGLPATIAATKPLLLLSLFALYLSQSKRSSAPISLKVLAALVFSLLGDVFLMFQRGQPLFFMLGLAAFLTAHIFYILVFKSIIKMQGGAGLKPITIAVVLLYAGALFYRLYPHLGSLQIPVIIYTIAISLMWLMAAHAPRPQSLAGNLLLMGAMLFVISDSVLAFNKFHTAFEAASFIIMLTYILAQGLLVFGLLSLEQKVK